MGNEASEAMPRLRMKENRVNTWLHVHVWKYAMVIKTVKQAHFFTLTAFAESHPIVLFKFICCLLGNSGDGEATLTYFASFLLIKLRTCQE